MEVAMAYASLGVALLFLAWQAGSAAADTPLPHPDPEPAFERVDRNHDGELSLEELIAAGMDDIAFRAMDSNGDNHVSPKEYARHRALKTQPPGPGARP
jgi:hypothetical protein